MGDPSITDLDMKRGIARASDRLHMPVTRTASRLMREEIAAARDRRVAGEPEPARDMPDVKRRALEIVSSHGCRGCANV